MKKLSLFLLVLPTILIAQTLDDLDFGTEETFEVVTWNIENFPKNEPATLQYVLAIIEALDADIIAIQEVWEYEALESLDLFLDEYTVYAQSLDRAGLAYLYRHDVVNITAAYELFTQAPEWNNFPRFPMVIEVSYANQDFVVINNHYKCCGNGLLDPTDPWDEETRRFTANVLMKEYIDTNLDNKAVFVVGDLNDVLIDAPIHNVFAPFLEDPENYQFADMDIATGGSSNWSFPNWPSHLDHILITDELFELSNMPNAVTETIKIETYLPGGWNEYDSNVSDHRPVGIRLPIPSTLSTPKVVLPKITTIPNPVTDVVSFSVSNGNQIEKVAIYSVLGQKIKEHTSVTSSSRSSIDLSNLASGIYFATITVDNVVQNPVKLIKK